MKAKFTYNGKMKAIYCLIISFCSLFAHANDLDMFCLKGPVDSVCIVMNDAGLEWQNEYVFDEQGNLIELDGEEFICERDADGRMKSVLLEDAVEDDEEKFTTIEMTLSYNSDGRVNKVVSTLPVTRHGPRTTATTRKACSKSETTTRQATMKN